MDNNIKELYGLYDEALKLADPKEAYAKKEEIFAKLKAALGSESKADEMLTDIFDLVAIYKEAYFIYGFEKAKGLLK